MTQNTEHATVTPKGYYWDKVRKVHISWAAVLLFAALLAQSPHAGLVFLRNALDHTGIEYALAVVGAVVYAIALEGATAFFVWKRKTKLAAAFALFSILHNFAYYLPQEWAFTVWGAHMVVRNVMGAILVSLSLPIAIAAFSYTAHATKDSATEDAKESATNGSAQPATAQDEIAQSADDFDADAFYGQSATIVWEDQELAQSAESADTQEDGAQKERKARKRNDGKMTPEMRRLHIFESGVRDVDTIMAQYGVQKRMAQMDLAEVRKMSLAPNGNGTY